VNQQLKSFLLNTSVSILTALAVVLAVVKVTQFRASSEAGAKVWFYDQKANHLYPTPRALISPDGKDGNRVRGVVVGFEGMGNNPNQLKIAYLEKFAPEFKSLLERAEAAHAAMRPFAESVPPASSEYYQLNSFVKRPDDAGWFAVGTEEGRRIMAEWRDWHGPQGQRPVISVPSNR
jgi:hypothetical protein